MTPDYAATPLHELGGQMNRPPLVALALIAFSTPIWCQQSSQSSVARPNTLGSRGVRQVLIVGGIDNTNMSGGTFLGLTSAEIYDAGTHTFTATGSMSEGRAAQAATVLNDGRVLVTGGDGADTELPVASAELYDPSTGTFSSVGDMTTERVGHISVLLANGLVLIAGGDDSNWAYQNTAELFDPVSRTFTAVGSMHDARTSATATLLKSGKVLVTAGSNGSQFLTTAELYDPSTRTFTYTAGNLAVGRWGATATLLDNGKVLIAGGGSYRDNCSGCSIASAEIYDPATDTFTTVGSMAFSRRQLAAVKLNNGQVLVAGGIEDEPPNSKELRSAELFDPRELTFSPAGGMTIPRDGHSANLLSNGQVLIAGGSSGSTETDKAELFDPTSGSFFATGNMTDARTFDTSTGIGKP